MARWPLNGFDHVTSLKRSAGAEVHHIYSTDFTTSTLHCSPHLQGSVHHIYRALFTTSTGFCSPHLQGSVHHRAMFTTCGTLIFCEDLIFCERSGLIGACVTLIFCNNIIYYIGSPIQFQPVAPSSQSHMITPRCRARRRTQGSSSNIRLVVEHRARHQTQGPLSNIGLVIKHRAHQTQNSLLNVTTVAIFTKSILRLI